MSVNNLCLLTTIFVLLSPLFLSLSKLSSHLSTKKWPQSPAKRSAEWGSGQKRGRESILVYSEIRKYMVTTVWLFLW